MADRELVEEAFKGTFVNPYKFGDDFAAVLKVCLANLCYHMEWIQDLTENHPMHLSWLSNNPDKWKRHKALSSSMVKTGEGPPSPC